MPSFLLTVAGTEREIQLSSLTVQHVVNGPDVLEGMVQDDDGSVALALDDIVELVQTDVSPASTYFKGLLQTKSSETWTGHGYGRLRRITAFDFGVYASFVQVFALEVGSGSPADTVSSLIATLVADYLGDYGTTVHPSQVTGPVLNPNAFDGMTAEAVLNAISEQTGWVWKFDTQNRLRMWDPATESAGFNVTATNGTYIGDIKSDQLRQRYYNRVFVEGGNGYWQTISDETHYGDGSKITFELNAPLFYYEVDYTSSLGFFVGLQLEVHRSGGTTVEYANDQLTAQWTFNPGPEYSLRQVSGAVLGPTEYILITGYAAQWPMRLVADGRGSPPAPARDLRVSRPSLFGRGAIQALADQLLTASQVEFDRSTYPTDEVDILPGQTQTIDVAEAGINGSYTCVSARLAYVTDGDTSAFRREVVTVNSITARSFWLDLYSRWLQDNQGATTAASMTPAGTVASTPSGTPGGSDTHVQFNDVGAFGGDLGFTYDKTAKAATVTGTDFTTIARGVSGGDSYGTTSFVFPAALVAKVTNQTSKLAQAWMNVVAGKAKALVLYLYNSGAVMLRTHGGLELVVSGGNDIDINARNINVYTEDTGQNTQLWLNSLVTIPALAWQWAYITATTHTISVSTGPSVAYFYDPSANATINLPGLTTHANRPLSGQQGRVYAFVNKSSLYTVTIDPSGSELIWNGSASATTLVLQPGASVVVQALSQSTAIDGWQVIASHNVPVKLDDNLAPDDNTDLNVSTTAHGLTPKLPNDATKFLDGTGVYTVPSAVGGGGGSVSAIDVERLLRAQQGLAVYSGCVVTEDNAGAGMDVDVAAGHIRLTTGAGLLVTAGEVTLATADVTNPRIDLVWVDSSGTLGKTDGTPAATPEPPNIPGGAILLAQVSVPANDTTITNSQITDKRTYTRLPQIIRKTADESVTSSAAPQDDDELKISVGASEKWIVECVLYVIAATAGDIRVGLAGPSGMTGTVGTVGVVSSSAGTSGDVVIDVKRNDFTDTGVNGVAGFVSPGSMVTIKAPVIVSSTPGVVVLRWAQLASSGTATTVKADSYLIAHLV